MWSIIKHGWAFFLMSLLPVKLSKKYSQYYLASISSKDVKPKAMSGMKDIWGSIAQHTINLVST